MSQVYWEVVGSSIYAKNFLTPPTIDFNVGIEKLLTQLYFEKTQNMIR
jgi:hypothetical protein